MIDLKDELKENVQKGTTWQNIYDALWHIGTIRYGTYEQLKNVFGKNTWAGKVLTLKSKKRDGKIPILKNLGYINHYDNDVLTLTEKGLEFLKIYSEYNTDIIQLPTGSGKKDGIYNAEVLMRVIKLPEFHALFYADSDFYENPRDHQAFLVPDAALVLKRGDKARLLFLEIENQKPNWANHVEGKKWKYSTIAKRLDTWDVWWRKKCQALKLDHCPIDEFGFSVWCIGGYKPDNDWPGWIFTEDVKI